MFCPSCKKLMRPKPSQGVRVCQKCRTTVRIQDSGTEKQQGPDTPTMTQFQYRPGQEELRKEILGEARKGTRVVLLEAPVGAGKSLILSKVAQDLHRDHGWTGYYTTPQVNLVDQLRADPLVNDKIQPIAGMDNYTCPIDPVPEKLKRSVSEAWCIHGRPCDHCRGRGSIGGKEKPVKCTVCQGKGTTTFKCSERYKSCKYFLDRRRAARGLLATMTMAYLLRVTRGTSVPQAEPMVTPVDVEEPPKFLQRDFLIVD
ncbi:MAG: hypothetical protein JRN08_05370 [Nitrososphaerota archaeon]|nr:hypothetical protein [Nitrososphaerota archaeon]